MSEAGSLTEPSLLALSLGGLCEFEAVPGPKRTRAAYESVVVRRVSFAVGILIAGVAEQSRPTGRSGYLYAELSVLPLRLFCLPKHRSTKSLAAGSLC